MWEILVVLSILAVAVGFIFLSEATTGVGIIAIGGVLGILARIAQASRYHKQVMDKLAALVTTTETATHQQLQEYLDILQNQLDEG